MIGSPATRWRARSPTRSRRMQDDVDVSSLFSFGSTAAIFSQTVKEQLQALLPEYLVMTDSIGSTEIGHERHPLRAEGRRAEGGHHDACRRRPTPSCSTTTSNPLEPGSGVVGRLARGGNIPLGYYNDPVKTAETFVTDAQGRRWSIPGDFALLEADGRITLLGRGSVSINSGGEKIYPGRGRGRAEVASRRVRRARGRRSRRTLGRAVSRAAAAAPGHDARRSRSCRRTAAPGSPATRSRGSCCSSTRCRGCPTASPTTGRAKEQAKRSAPR